MGADHSDFHAPNSGEYGPYRPDGVGLSIGINAYGFVGSFSIAVEEMINFGFYASTSSSVDYPSGCFGIPFCIDWATKF